MYTETDTECKHKGMAHCSYYNSQNRLRISMKPKLKGGGGGGLSADVEENDLVFEIKQAKV